MALLKSADSLIAEISESIRRELIDVVAPLVRRVAEAAAELEAALGSGGAKRRGRPKGTGRKPGRPAGKRGPGRPKKAKVGRPAGKRGPGRPPKAKVGRPKGSGSKATRTPRGAMKQAILDVLGKAPSAIKLSAIRDAILQMPAYKGRNEKALYTQIVLTIQKAPEVIRTPKGEYTLKSKK